MYEQLIKEKNLSVTKQRLALLKALDGVKDPVTIEYLKSCIPLSMDTSTLYRSLRALVDAGIVYQTDFRDGASYFELQREHHHHIVCTQCKKREKIYSCLSDQFVTLEKTTGYTIHNHIFEIFGLCKNCSS